MLSFWDKESVLKKLCYQNSKQKMEIVLNYQVLIVLSFYQDENMNLSLTIEIILLIEIIFCNIDTVGAAE
jgi:hypothetical protein